MNKPLPNRIDNCIRVISYEAPVDLSTLSISGLIARCADSNDSAAWEEFVNRFHPTLAGAICRMLRSYGASSAALLDDLVQDAFVRLCKDRCRALREFQSADEKCFYGLLRATAISVVQDYLRRVHTVKRRADATADNIDDRLNLSLAAPGGERTYIDALTLDHIDRILQEGDPASVERNRLVFWLHHRDGFSAAEIARIPAVGLGAKGVDTLLRRLRIGLEQRGFSAGVGGDNVP